jgi:UDP-N-acetylglucosamine acyltransferase
MPQIHPTAIVAPGAMLAEDVVVGPYCIVGENVSLDAGVMLRSHVVVDGRTTIGAGTRIFPFASIGLEPQDLKYRVGDSCLFMVGAHVAHDCRIADHVIMANNATLAGHVVIDDYAVLGGLCAIHQYVRIGRHAMIGGMSGVERDVIPYGQVMGDRARLCGLNIIGMQRRGFSREDIQGLRSAYQSLFSSDGTLSDRVDVTAERFSGIAPVDDILDFIRADSSRAICQPKGANDG